MSWTCPKCSARNSTVIARDAEPGRIVAVDCPSCGAQHEASVVFPRWKVGPLMTVGVIWV